MFNRRPLDIMDARRSGGGEDRGDNGEFPSSTRLPTAAVPLTLTTTTPLPRSRFAIISFPLHNISRFLSHHRFIKRYVPSPAGIFCSSVTRVIAQMPLYATVSPRFICLFDVCFWWTLISTAPTHFSAYKLKLISRIIIWYRCVVDQVLLSYLSCRTVWLKSPDFDDSSCVETGIVYALKRCRMRCKHAEKKITKHTPVCTKTLKICTYMR